ncbi:MAG: hypothetical protein KME17_17870 [Cyanosarcina radialis HA8281-LM2]|jgi:hypothetical protein|nr:hypothetical protein [Cyanosarcina radialis HA8281-LM2]
MFIPSLDIEENLTIDLLKEYIKRHNNFKVNITKFIGYNSNLDIADEYFFSLFLGERLYPFCESISYLEDSRNITFEICPKQIKLNELTSFLFDFYSEWTIEFENSIDDFKISLKKQKLFFPELADKYMANIIAGIDDVCLDEEELKSLYSENPEEKFEFWLSFISPHLGYDVYMSSWAWIIPYRSNRGEVPHDLGQALKLYGGVGKDLPMMEKADDFCVGNLPPVVLSNSAIMLFPRNGFSIARKCVLSILQKSESLQPYYLNNVEPYQVLLSEDGCLMIVKDYCAQYVFFIDRHCYSSESELSLKSLEYCVEQDYQNVFDRLTDKFISLSGNHVDISCPWEKIDDELFEQLCYDLIIYSSDFDPDTRHKMGKSRSRDGGRDIEIYTRSRWNEPRVKWIIQCKLLSRGATLSGAKVQVSDVLDQYGAGGFCIMTSGIIDATLHDKLDGIERNRRIGVEKWDYMKIERVLAKPKYQNIRKRYFGV